MSRTGKIVVIFEGVGYGVLLNFGYLYDTVTAALITLCIVVDTWAVDALFDYVRTLTKRS